MLLVFVSFFVAAVGGVYWFFARRGRSNTAAPRPTKPAGGRFGSVEIRTRNGACEPARALDGQRFLVKDAPSLPLPACDVTKCSCTFAKLSDRRTDDRRFEHGGLSAAMFLKTNRRAKRERRRVQKTR
jgi:hypothetical protein